MPVSDQESIQLDECPCCGDRTRKSTGKVILDDRSEALYIARWTEHHPEHGMAFLILLPGAKAFVSILYSFEASSFMVVSEDDCNWYLNQGERIFDREEVIGTPLANRVFSFIDEIWEQDPDVADFHTHSQC